MVICKEIDYYLKYAEEHQNWINKKRKLLLKNIVKPLMKRDDVFLTKKHTGTALNIARAIIISYSHFKNSYMHLRSCTWMTFRFFPRFL